MSSKIDNIDLEAPPEAAPETAPETTNDDKKKSSDDKASRKNLWIGLAALFVVIAVVAITVPLVMKSKDNDTDAKAVEPEAASQQAGTFGLDQPAVAACTMELAICPDGTSVGRSGPNCEFEPCPGGACPLDIKVCPDGTEVSRDANNNCEFEVCPNLGFCPRDVRPCSDGSSVGRSGPDCHFEICPDGECPIDRYECTDGSEVFRDLDLHCDFPACPNVGACPRDVRPCSDGSSVGRSGPECHFEICPDGTCPVDIFECDDGSEVLRDLALHCDFPACPGEGAVQLPAEENAVACTMEVRACPDGSSVGRVGPDCEFEPCPEIPAQLPEGPPPAACTMELAICADGTSVGRSGPDCHFEACPDGGCPTDSYTCPDGTELFRDAARGCEFIACPEESAVQLPAEEQPALAACTLELRPCADGSSVGRSGPNCQFEACPDGGCPIDTYTCPDGLELLRNPALGCEFDACPEAVSKLPAAQPEEVVCTMDVQECPDGSFVGHVAPNCEFEACPGGTPSQLPEAHPAACTLELEICSDGTQVGRSGPNCEFEPCPDGACPLGEFTCEDGSVLARDPALGCEFPSCEQPAVVACTMDLGICADGTSVVRTAPYCDFELCPDGSCTIDTFLCPDGSEVSRDPQNNCQFPACPPVVACPLDVRPCPDGSSVSRVGPNCEFAECPVSP